MASAAWALAESGVTAVDARVAWHDLRAAGEPLVLHDSLCPMTPPSFIADCLREAIDSGEVVVGVRPVTDTVKVLTDGLVGEGVDRDDLLAITSPLVLPAAIVSGLAGPPPHDLAAAVSAVAALGHPVRHRVAPPEGRRVTSRDAVLVLEALSGPAR